MWAGLTSPSGQENLLALPEDSWTCGVKLRDLGLWPKGILDLEHFSLGNKDQRPKTKDQRSKI